MQWKTPGYIFHGLENRARLHCINGGMMNYKRPTLRQRLFVGRGGMNNKRQAPCGPWITRSFEQGVAGYDPQAAAMHTLAHAAHLWSTARGSSPER